MSTKDRMNTINASPLPETEEISKATRMNMMQQPSKQQNDRKRSVTSSRTGARITEVNNHNSSLVTGEGKQRRAGSTSDDSSEDIASSSSSMEQHRHSNPQDRFGKATITASSQSMKSDGTSGALLADALSSCLANIVAAEGEEGKSASRGASRSNNNSGINATNQTTTTSAGKSLRANNDEKVCTGSGCMSSSSSSNNGSERMMQGERSGEGAATITANATTSEGDDRDSSLSGGNRSGGAGAARATTSSGDDQPSSGDSKRRTKETPSVELGAGANAQRHYHHHRSQRKHTPGEATLYPNATDGYGPAVHLDDHHYEGEYSYFRAQQEGSEHTTIVAHLPPTSTDNSTASAAEGEYENVNTYHYREHYQQQQHDARARESGSLLQPYREPGFHAIRRTFNKFARRGDARQKTSETDSSNEQPTPHKRARRSQKPSPASLDGKPASKPKKRVAPANRSDRGSDDDIGGTGGSSSGSGTEGGYAGSASSNENVAKPGCCSSPSVSSSEDSLPKHKRHKGQPTASGGHKRPMLSKKQESSISVSSEIADFSSGASEGETASDGYTFNAFRDLPSESPSITSSSNGDGSSDDQEESYTEKKVSWKILKPQDDTASAAWSHVPLQVPTTGSDADQSRAIARLKTDENTIDGKPPILALGCDVMAHVLTFMEPPDILSVLTMPLSKDWLSTFTRQPELWRVLCLLEPFKVQVDADSEDGDDSSDDSLDSYPEMESHLKCRFGKFRLLYTSFVRCMRYLARIKDDAVHGRPPSVIDYGTADVANSGHNIGANQNLRQFLARARGILVRGQRQQESSETDGSYTDNAISNQGAAAVPVDQVVGEEHVGVSDYGSSTSRPCKRRRNGDKNSSEKKRKIRYGTSQITNRLLGPSLDGNTVGHTELPWSCAIYSIVNWMVAFTDVEGIQTMCLKVLPFLLEDEQQRITAQRAGLTDIVLRGMVMFPDSAILHTAAFHTIVLLARPLGGREGMLFHTSMVNSSGIFSSNSSSESGKNGIAVMLDSMRRFRRDEVLQAMSCWSLVNIALAPAQKEVLVQLGGIEVTANAMIEHPYNAEVQFRALFALINLVIPSVSLNPADQDQEIRVSNEDSTEREMLDEMVDQIVNLVVLAMKNFCSSEAILNRACLVLHNVSLTQEYHGALLWTPHCYQMLEWCLANYRTDQVLQQSAAGTLHRLQMTLSSDDQLRARFAASIQTQQQLSLEHAHREAMFLHEQQQEQLLLQQQQQQQNEEANGGQGAIP